MRINNINTPKYTPNFQAKFLHSEGLKQVVQYAVEQGEFDKLNQARKNIERLDCKKRIMLDIDKTQEGNSVVKFSLLEPKQKIIVPKILEGYSTEKVIEYTCSKTNPLDIALLKLIKLGTNAPNNAMYQRLFILK